MLKPEVLWVRGSRMAISAVRDWTPNLTLQRRREGKGVEILVPLRGEEGAGVFHFSGGHVVIPAGYRADWKTIAHTGS